MQPSAIVGVGSALPEHRVASAEIEERLGLEAGWIERRTGILERPIAGPDEATSDLAVRAGTRALTDAGVPPAEVGLLLLATSTPDHPLPPTAPAVAHRLALSSAGAVDVAGACAGFLYGLVLGDAYRRLSESPVLVIGANVLSRRTDQSDPSTAALFSDGAGAVVLGHDRTGADRGIRGSWLGADGSLSDGVVVPAGGSRIPLTPDAVARGEHLMKMKNGASLFHDAVRAMAEAGEGALKAAGWTPDDVDLFVPHQAGHRLMAGSARLLGIGPERIYEVVEHTGNSSAATIPIALAEADRSGRLAPGDRLLLVAVGAGLVSAGVAITW
ncbi:MAG: beta-ketoacyl-ACP synthase 3 [Actinomycetota bacterium]|nr:beta-ketoacyl-ACP synthase 3 [Actinomycetota bacterium]